MSNDDVNTGRRRFPKMGRSCLLESLRHRQALSAAALVGYNPVEPTSSTPVARRATTGASFELSPPNDDVISGTDSSSNTADSGIGLPAVSAASGLALNTTV